jgi:hypothetical protein
MKDAADTKTPEFPEISATVTKKRGRPSTGRARTAAQRKRDQRANMRTVFFGTSEDGGKPFSEWTLQECLFAMSDPKIRASLDGQAAWRQFGKLMQFV